MQLWILVTMSAVHALLSVPAVNVQTAENHSQYHRVNSINIHLYNYGNLVCSAYCENV